MSLQALRQEDADVFVSRSISPLTSNHPLQGPPLLAFPLVLLQPFPCAPPTTSFPPTLLQFLHFFSFLLLPPFISFSPSFCFSSLLLIFLLLLSPLSIILFPFLPSSVSLLPSFSFFSSFHSSVYLLPSIFFSSSIRFLILTSFCFAYSLIPPLLLVIPSFSFFFLRSASTCLLIYCLLSLSPFCCNRVSYPSFVFRIHLLSSLLLHHSAVSLVIFYSVLSSPSYILSTCLSTASLVFLSESVSQLLS